MSRKILYGICGFVVGGVTGLIIGACLSQYLKNLVSENMVVLLLTTISGLAGLFFAIQLAAWKNLKEGRRSKIEIAHGNFYVVVQIFIIQESLVGSAIGAIFLWSGISLQEFISIVDRNRIAMLLISIPVMILSSWGGVQYVSQKSFLKKFHSPLKISLWLVLLNVDISFFLAYEHILKGLWLIALPSFVIFLSCFYFLKKAFRKLA